MIRFLRGRTNEKNDRQERYEALRNGYEIMDYI